MESFIPKKFCFKIEPPTLVLFYELENSGKIHRRSIPLRNFNENSRVDDIIKGLNDTHHGKYLKKIPQKQVHQLLTKLHDRIYNYGMASSSKSHEDEEEDLNKLDDDELNKVKDKMSVSFEQHRIKPGDENWKYDIEVDFEVDGENKIESGWDSGESDLEF